MGNASLIEDHTAIITGGAGGIGLAVAKKALIDYKMRVVIIDIDLERLQLAHSYLSKSLGIKKSKSKNRILSLRVDVTDLKDVKKMHMIIIKKWPAVPISFLFNNAGVQFGRSTYQTDINKYWRRIIDINIFGILNMLNVFIPTILSQQDTPCRIVNTASVGGLFNTFMDTGAPYTVSKQAVVTLTECLAIEIRNRITNLDPNLITVHVLCPGLIKLIF